jgi:hypothetical protein
MNCVVFSTSENDDFSSTKAAEQSYKTSRENDQIDSKYGFDRVRDGTERTGYLINMHSVREISLISAFRSNLKFYRLIS